MTERQQPLQEEREDNFSEIENQILTKYYGELGFQRVLEASKKNGYTTGIEILAKNYDKLTDNKRVQIIESLDYLRATKKHEIKLQASYALSKIGDFSLAFEAIEENLQVDRYTLRSTGNSLIGIGLEKNDRDGNVGDFFDQAFQLAYKQDNDADSHAIAASVMKAVDKVGGSTLQYLDDAIKKALDLDNRQEYSAYWKNANQETLARELAYRGLNEEAKKASRNVKIQDNEGDNWKKFHNGEYEGAMRGLKKPEDRLPMAMRISKNLMNEGKSPEKFIGRIKQILKNKPELADINSELIFAQYNFSIGKNPQEYFEKALTYATSEKEATYKIDSLRDLIKVQHATTGIPKKSFIELDKAFGQGKTFLEDLGPDADKLDRLETLMSFEDTAIALAEIGQIEEAVKAYESTLELCKTYSPEDSNDSFSLDFYAQLALTDLEDKRIAITQKNLEKVCRATNNKTLKAIGYLELININTFKKLPIEKQIAIAIGTRQRDYVNIMRQEKMISEQELKNALQDILGQESEGSINELRNLLVEEMKSENGDYRIIARITKGLIEKGDIQGKEIAATLFSESSLPEEIRMYIAKKLCKSGYWDPQIIEHFRNYKNKGKENTTLEQINIETLEAIVNQMHATPSLAIYKVLETTRLNKGKKQLDVLTDLGNFIFMLPNMDIETKIKVFSEKAELINEGKMKKENIEKLKDGYKAILSSEF